MTDNNVGYWFAADIPDIFEGNICPHSLADFDHAVTGRIDADILDTDFRIWNNKSGGHKVGGRGNVSRNDDFLSVQTFNRT